MKFLSNLGRCMSQKGAFKIYIKEFKGDAEAIIINHDTASRVRGCVGF